MKLYRRTRSPFWWFDARDRNGYRVRLSTRCTDERAAAKVMADFLADEEATRTGIQSHRKGPRPLSDAIQAYEQRLRDQQRTPAYIVEWRRDVDRAVLAMGWRTLADVTTDSLREWMKRNEHHSPSTQRHRLEAIRAVTRYAHAAGMIKADAGALLAMPKGGARIRRRALSQPELERLFANPHRGDVYRVLVLTGLRRGEAAAVTREMIVLDDRPRLELPGSITKSGRDEQIPLVAQLLPILARMLMRPGPNPIRVPSSREFAADLATAQIPKVDGNGRVVVLHCLRHSTATGLIANGVAPGLAAKVLRHADGGELAMSTYTDASLLPLREALERMGGDFNGDRSTDRRSAG